MTHRRHSVRRHQARRPGVNTAIACGAVLWVIAVGNVGMTQTPVVTSAGVSMTGEQSRQAIQWLADQLMRHVPSKFDGDSHWGETKRVWAGFKFSREGAKISTHRRHRELRHGRWVKYEITLPEAVKASQKRPAVSLFGPVGDAGPPLQIDSVTPVRHAIPSVTQGGESIAGWAVNSRLRTPAKFAVRVQRYNLDVQWYSIEITGQMELELATRSMIAITADYSEIPPAIQLRANVDAAELIVHQFEVDRISKVGGDVAEELGELAEDTILKLWLRKENEKLDDRLNRAIAKNEGDLRWSMMDWLQTLSKPAAGR